MEEQNFKLERRKIVLIRSGRVTYDGAGVRLNRVFTYNDDRRFDPFLLLDHFGSSNPLDYLPGFPWHPHRGIETVTYMLEGRVEHGDSLGNSGVIRAGDVQWMSAGSGIIHQEMPKQAEGILEGFQLWVNLPRGLKMSTPIYRGIKSTEIPAFSTPEGGKIRVISGEYRGAEGPVRGLPVDPTYLDVSLPPSAGFSLQMKKGYTAFAYIVRGSGRFDAGSGTLEQGQVGLYDTSGSQISVRAGTQGLRFIMVAGRPLGEPVAWWGPIVMNTADDIALALTELKHGTFIKHRKVVVEE